MEITLGMLFSTLLALFIISVLKRRKIYDMHQPKSYGYHRHRTFNRLDYVDNQ